MNKTVSRVLWIVAGVLLIVAGGACMLHPGAALSGLSFLLGMAMLFSGVVDIIIFATAGSSIYGSGWFLVVDAPYPAYTRYTPRRPDKMRQHRIRHDTQNLAFIWPCSP